MKKDKIILFSAIIIVAIISIFLFTFNHQDKIEKSIQQTTKKTNQSSDNLNRKISETRTVEIHLNSEFTVDRSKNSFITDEKGTIKGNIMYKHLTLNDEQIAVYAFLESDSTPVKIEINGSVDSHHIIDVPKEGTKKVPFTISNLPPGKHIIYIISEKLLNDKIHDPLEIYRTQKAVSGNYLSLEVNNKSKEVATIQNIYNEVHKIENTEKEEDLLLMRMYEDSDFIKEAEFVRKEDYFLVIDNNFDFDVEANLKLISQYTALDLQQVLIPAKSKVMVPIDLKDTNINNSARIIMVGQPKEELDIPLPFRTVKITNRLPVVK